MTPRLRWTALGLPLLLMLAWAGTARVDAQNRTIGVNVVLTTDITPAILKDLGRFGRVLDQIPEIDALTMRAREKDVAAIAALPYVAAANPDAERTGAPVDTVPVSDFANGLSTWNLDAIDVTDVGFDNRQFPDYDGTGIYVAVLDSGLLDSWRQYFPQERIAVQYAKSFSGGGGERGNVSEPPNLWEHDQNSHGTHVTSTILGYSLGGTPVNGVAPMASVIPVRVLNQAGFGWSSVIAGGIMYVAELKESGALGSSPVVINMSLGGPSLDALERVAIDYAISQGVIIVAAAGNGGNRGMGYPGAYAPVISVAASGWIGEWYNSRWWWALDVAEPTDPEQFYITDFSSRALPGQDLDVAAPGSWIVGPYQTNSGQTSYYFLGGTSMASPHVAGIVALMLDKNPSLGVTEEKDIAAEAESILEGSAIALGAGCRNVRDPSGAQNEICWGADATGWGLATAKGALEITP